VVLACIVIMGNRYELKYFSCRFERYSYGILRVCSAMVVKNDEVFVCKQNKLSVSISSNLYFVQVNRK